MTNNSLKIYKLLTNRSIKDTVNLFNYLKDHYSKFECEDYKIIKEYLKDFNDVFLDYDMYLLNDINDKFDTEYKLLLLKSIEDKIKDYDKELEVILDESDSDIES